MNKIKKSKKIIKRLYKSFRQTAIHLHLRKIEIIVLAIILVEFLFPQVTLAQKMQEPSYRIATIMWEEEFQNNDSEAEVDTIKVNFDNNLPSAEYLEPKQVIWITVTAYSSTVDQCDSSPCITANGFNVCQHNTEDIVAANFLSFGTKLKMPDYFGDKVFTVQDRMNARYYYRIDVWMKSRQAAKEFGIRKLKIEIY